jgi:hypothetical protein
VVALRSLGIGCCGAIALAVVIGGACGSSPDVTSDGGRDGVAARNDAAHDAPPREDARIDQARDSARIDAARTDAASTDAARDANGSDGTVPDCTLGTAGQPLDLRCTGLYSDWATRTIASDVRQYDPGLHLWSDGASKTRWIYLPPGTKIDTSNMDQWTFPPGTKIWKEFVVGGARLETRLLWKKPTGSWYLTTYEWSSDESTATELTTGKLGADGASFEIPTQSACYDCHGGRYDNVLGFEAVALSTPQASGVTMATLTAGNLLTAPPTSPITIPGDATAAAALGYLHMNCGNPCHNPDSGQAASSNLLMRLDVATLASVETTQTWTTGVGADAYFHIPGEATNRQIFAPCDPDDSIAYYRMNRRDGVDGTPGGVQMPPEITHQVDTSGVALIAAWLDSLPQCSSTTTH